MEYYKERDSCRVCGSKSLRPVLSLGEHYVVNFVDSGAEKPVKAPMDLVLCNAKTGGCGLVQLRHTTSVELLYRQYWYKSGINQTMRDALADITDKAEKLVKLSSDDIVIDIGCNDGTLLRSYRNKEIQTIGFDPAENLVPESSVGTTKIINDFFNYPAFKKNLSDKKAKVITSIAMFYDLDDPNTFVSDIGKALDDNGLWIVQQNYLVGMLEQRAFDNIVHEHLEYYSLLAMNNLLKRHNMEIFDVELNNLNGGSFRTYIRKKGNTAIKPFQGAEKRLKDVERREAELGLDDTKIYDDFASNINGIRDKVVNFVKAEKAKGKKIYVYGASTRGNTMLQYFGLNNSIITAAAERSKDKWGKKTVGTNIPIISEEQARKEKPDYFLVLPWFFRKEFIQRESDYLRAGGKFIFPLPKFDVVGAEAASNLIL